MRRIVLLALLLRLRRSDDRSRRPLQLGRAARRDDGGSSPAPFHDVPRATFRAEAAKLSHPAPELTRAELVVGVIRLAALPGPRDGPPALYPSISAHRAAHLPTAALRLRRRHPRRRLSRPGWPDGTTHDGDREHAVDEVVSWCGRLSRTTTSRASAGSCRIPSPPRRSCEVSDHRRRPRHVLIRRRLGGRARPGGCGGGRVHARGARRRCRRIEGPVWPRARDRPVADDAGGRQGRLPRLR